jgi:MFS family permease
MSAPLWLLTLITFSGTLAMHIFVPALPEAARSLGASIGEMQLTMSVYIFGLAVGQLAYGPLSDASAGDRCWSRAWCCIRWPASPPASSAMCTT